jgi:hypothetical protein
LPVRAIKRRNTQRRQYTKPDSIRSARILSRRSELLPLLNCVCISRRYSLGVIVRRADKNGKTGYSRGTLTVPSKR